LAILGPLRDLDEVAYLRFASVYRSFSSIEDFEKEIRSLRDLPRHDYTKDPTAPDGERPDAGSMHTATERDEG